MNRRQSASAARRLRLRAGRCVGVPLLWGAGMVGLLSGCLPEPEPDLDAVAIPPVRQARMSLVGPSPRVYPHRRCVPDTGGRSAPAVETPQEGLLPVWRKVAANVPVTVVFTFPALSASDSAGAMPSCRVARRFQPRADALYEWVADRQGPRCSARVQQLTWLEGRVQRQAVDSWLALPCAAVPPHVNTGAP